MKDTSNPRFLVPGDPEVTCLRCGERPSTGVMLQMCDPCFTEWEADINARGDASPTGRVELNDIEAAELNAYMGRTPEVKA